MVTTWLDQNKAFQQALFSAELIFLKRLRAMSWFQELSDFLSERGLSISKLLFMYTFFWPMSDISFVFFWSALVRAAHLFSSTTCLQVIFNEQERLEKSDYLQMLFKATKNQSPVPWLIFWNLHGAFILSRHDFTLLPRWESNPCIWPQEALNKLRTVSFPVGDSSGYWACCRNPPYDPRGVTTSLLADLRLCMGALEILSLWGPNVLPLTSFSRLGFRVIGWVVISLRPEFREAKSY